MFANTKKTIIKILCLYLGTSAIFLCIGFYFLIAKESENIIFSQMANLMDTYFEIRENIRKNKFNINEALIETLKNINTPFAIYDKNNNLLFSNLSKNPNEKEMKNGFYRFNNKIIVNPELFPKHRKNKKIPYNIFLEDNNADSKILFMKLKFISYFLLVLIFMGLISYILVRLFLKPLNEYIKALDVFIKDSTHEINTPLSVILMSIETLKKDNLDTESKKKIQRIKLASLQLSHIYSDLVAYNFPHSIQNITSKLNLDIILKERLDFFTPFFIQKQLQITSDIEKVEFEGNKERLVLCFDNLLNNAIKYNIKGGKIHIILKKDKFIIEDSGCGIEMKNINKIFKRYYRFNSSSGGFGIGLSLVKQICDEYNINISLKSSKNGTIFTLNWQA